MKLLHHLHLWSFSVVAGLRFCFNVCRPIRSLAAILLFIHCSSISLTHASVAKGALLLVWPLQSIADRKPAPCRRQGRHSSPRQKHERLLFNVDSGICIPGRLFLHGSSHSESSLISCLCHQGGTDHRSSPTSTEFEDIPIIDIVT